LNTNSVNLYSNATSADVGNPGSITQTVTGITAGCAYQLSFGAKAADNQKPGKVTIMFRNAANMALATFTETLTTNGPGFTAFLYRFIAPTGTTNAVIEFSQSNTGEGVNFFVDNVIFARS
jgi:hypothetical protein